MGHHARRRELKRGRAKRLLELLHADEPVVEAIDEHLARFDDGNEMSKLIFHTSQLDRDFIFVVGHLWKFLKPGGTLSNPRNHDQKSATAGATNATRTRRSRRIAASTTPASAGSGVGCCIRTRGTSCRRTRVGARTTVTACAACAARTAPTSASRSAAELPTSATC